MKIKCPICKGEANRQWFSHLEEKHPNKLAVFICECWSGSRRKQSKYHYFIAKIKIPVEIEIDQILQLEQTIQTLENQINEEEKEE